MAISALSPALRMDAALRFSKCACLVANAPVFDTASTGLKINTLERNQLTPAASSEAAASMMAGMPPVWMDGSGSLNCSSRSS